MTTPAAKQKPAAKPAQPSLSASTIDTETGLDAPDPIEAHVERLDEMSELQEQVDRQVEEMMLDDGSIAFMGRTLRPIKLSSLVMLKSMNSSLVAGKPLHECPDILLDACKFVYLQSLPLKEAIKVSKDPDELELGAMEFCEEIDGENAQGFVDAVLAILASTQKGRVTPIVKNQTRDELSSIASMGE